KWSPSKAKGPGSVQALMIRSCASWKRSCEKNGLTPDEWVFRADAAHEPSDDPPLRQIVEHRELFRDVDRVIYQRQGAAKDCDLDLLGALDQRAGDQIGRRHQAVGGLVM